MLNTLASDHIILCGKKLVYFQAASYSGPQQLKMGIPILVEPIFLQSASRGGSQLTTL